MRKRRPPLIVQFDRLVTEVETQLSWSSLSNLDRADVDNLVLMSRRLLNNLRIYDFTKKRPRTIKHG